MDIMNIYTIWFLVRWYASQLIIVSDAHIEVIVITMDRVIRETNYEC